MKKKKLLFDDNYRQRLRCERNFYRSNKVPNRYHLFLERERDIRDIANIFSYLCPRIQRIHVSLTQQGRVQGRAMRRDLFAYRETEREDSLHRLTVIEEYLSFFHLGIVPVLHVSSNL